VRLAHIAISVSDLGRAIAFYHKNFGLKCSEKFRIRPLGLEIALLKNKNLCLELFHFKAHKSLPKYRRNLDSDLKTIGVKHLAFAVKDIEAQFRKLKKAKVKFATEMRIFASGARYFFIKDPDGILVEVIQT